MRSASPTPEFERLVQRVNELYHDAINENYHGAAPEIFELEGERWRRTCADFIRSEKPLTLIEIGTGTGFVPLTIGPLLKAGDLFICSDISAAILGAAQRNLEAAALPCRFEFRKIEPSIPLALPFNDGAADILLMNSVLHHIQDTSRFLGEIDRVLRPGGRLIIAHEPNRSFYEHLLLITNFRIFDAILNIRIHIVDAARKLGILGALRRCYYFFRPGKRGEMGVKSREQDALCARVNEKLLAEGLVPGPLSNQEILDLIDIRADEGFFVDRLLPSWRLLHLETYHHLFWVTVNHRRNRFVRAYDRWLARRFPQQGATFTAVWEKPESFAAAV